MVAIINPASSGNTLAAYKANAAQAGSNVTPNYVARGGTIVSGSSSPMSSASTSSTSSSTSSSGSTSASSGSTSSSTSTSSSATEPAAKSSGSLSSGAKAGLGVGIALGCLLLLAVVAGIFFCLKRRRSKTAPGGTREPRPGHAEAQGQEIKELYSPVENQRGELHGGHASYQLDTHPGSYEVYAPPAEMGYSSTPAQAELGPSQGWAQPGAQVADPAYNYQHYPNMGGPVPTHLEGYNQAYEGQMQQHPPTEMYQHHSGPAGSAPAAAPQSSEMQPTSYGAPHSSTVLAERDAELERKIQALEAEEERIRTLKSQLRREANGSSQ